MRSFSFFILVLIGLYYIEPFECEFAVHEATPHNMMRHIVMLETQPEMKDALPPVIAIPILFFFICLIGLPLLLTQFIAVFANIYYSTICRISDPRSNISWQVLRI